MKVPNPEIQATLISGVQAQNAGQLDKAKAAYNKILEAQPDHADANHLLGVIHHQLGEHDPAIKLIDKAIKINPNEALFYNNLGNAQRGLGNLWDAIESYRKALSIKPDSTEALTNQGLALHDLGSYEEAIDCYKKALEIKPDLIDAIMKLGIIQEGMGRLDEAIEQYKKAISIKPNDETLHYILSTAYYKNDMLIDAAACLQMSISINPNDPDIYNHLSTIQLELKKYEEAAKSCQKAIDLQDLTITFNSGLDSISEDQSKENFDAHSSKYLAYNNLGLALREMDREEEAEASFLSALEINPNYAPALNNLGSLILKQGNIEEAEKYFREAILIDPKYPEAQSSLGSALGEQDKLDEAERACRFALELDSQHRQAKMNLSMNILRMGQLREGWQNYESRKSLDRAATDFPQPQWDGSSLAGKRIILWREQGLGDEVRFASIVPDLQKTEAIITIECDQRLTDIFARSFPDVNILATPYTGAAEQPDQFDYQCPLAGLARFFRNDYEAFTKDKPGYLKADPALIKLWKKRLSDISDRPKIGLSWNSTVKERASHFASIEELAPILNIDGIDFVNLQSQDSSEDIAKAKEKFGIEIHSWDDLDNRNDLNGVAALTSCLDLVISFPCFSSELAGAIGVPTFCFVDHKDSFDELGSKDNIWYPNTHHISKDRNEQWPPVFEKIVEKTRSRLGL